MQKAIAAIVGGIITILAQFGIVVPESVQGIVSAILPVLTAGAVYLIPNKT